MTARAAHGLIVMALCLATVPSLQAQDSTTETPASDPGAALVEILRDDASREALIAELERGAEMSEPAPAAEPVSVTRRIAGATQDVVERVAGGAASAWNALQGAPAALDNIGAQEIRIVLDAAQDLLLVIASTVIAFIALRSGARAIFRRMGARAHSLTFAGKCFLFVGSGLIDVGVVILAWGIGYGLAATVIGQFGEVAIRQSLYLNAFLLLELTKVFVRLAISPATRELRPLPISDQGARRLYRTLNIAASIVGYGLLLIVPIVTANASVAAGNSVSSAIILLAAIYLALASLRRRKPVANWLLAQARLPLTEPGEGIPNDSSVVVEDTAEGAILARQPRRQGFYGLLARKWHLLAIIWLAFVVVTALSRPISAIVDVFQASGLVGIAIVAAVVLSGMLSRAIGKGVRLPPHWAANLPRLEGRLNGFVPQILTGLRMALVLAVGLFIVDVIGVFDVGSWLASPPGLALVGTTLSVLAIIGVAFGLWLALSSWVEFRLNPEVGSIPTAREQTLLTLLRNALTIALLVITLMFALSEIGLDIGPLLASAGVLGLAIGFGAQKLVQDVITGVFIQFENAMNVGDVVTAGPVTGVVEKLTIRSVSLRDLHGVFHLVPFSSVDAVSNFMRDFSCFVADIGVAYREDIEEARQAMFDAFDELRRDPDQAPHLLGELEWFGLDQFADSAIVVRARIKTAPGKQWGVGRAYNGIIKRIFDERGIEIPFPHTTIFFGENKGGQTQALRVEADAEATSAAG